MTRVAGKDASKQFWKYHNEGILKKYQPKLKVGSLDSKPKPPPAAPKDTKPAAKPTQAPIPAASPAGSDVAEDSDPLDPYGDLVPYADPNWYQSVSKNPL